MYFSAFSKIIRFVMVANAQIAERRIKHASVVLRLTFATVLIANGLAAAHVINSFPVATAVSKDAIQVG